MKMRKIGSLEVSVVGLGANNFGTDFFGDKCNADDAARIIDAALDAGVNFIDTAEEYSSRTAWGSGRSEEFIGRALGPRRDQVVIASKFSTEVPDAPEERGAKRIVRAVEGSLKRLGTDRIDLYQQHFPDPRVPIDEMLEALDRLVRDGKVREIGCCNFSGAMIDAAQSCSEARGLSRFATLQTQYNLLDRPNEEGALEARARHGMMLLPYFPLASGLLTGKYRKGEAAPPGSRFASNAAIATYLRERQYSDARIEKAERLGAFARERGRTLLELAMSWLASQPFVASVIAGVTRPEQIRSNVAAAGWDLTPEDFAAVAAIVEER
jgi:aryl-alcohol dehydrogenase-like predicted oxidoreductase